MECSAASLTSPWMRRSRRRSRSIPTSASASASGSSRRVAGDCACRKSNPEIWWCNPPRIGRQRMCPASSAGREIGASFSRDRCVRVPCTTAHQNTYLSMLLKRRDFADWDVIPRGILGSVVLVRLFKPSQDRVGRRSQYARMSPTMIDCAASFAGSTTTGAGSNAVPAHFGSIEEDSSVLDQWSAVRSRDMGPRGERARSGSHARLNQFVRKKAPTPFSAPGLFFGSPWLGTSASPTILNSYAPPLRQELRVKHTAASSAPNIPRTD